jgi:diguanylate cyclase (GGDEF)-like protein
MKLNYKALMIIGFAWLIFLITSYFELNYYLLSSYKYLERDQVNDNLVRIDGVLDQFSTSLETFTADWAHWNDMYSYLKGKNPSFIHNNMTMAGFLNSSINMMTIWNLQEQMVYGVGIDTENKKMIPLPEDLQLYLHPGSLLVKWNDVDTTMHGYLLVNNKVMMVAASGITDGNKINRSIGVLISGRYVSRQLVEMISSITKVDVHLYVADEINRFPEIARAYKLALQSPNGHYYEAIDSHTLAAYSLVTDVYGKPIAIFGASMPRSLYATGIHAIHYYLASYVVAGIFFSILMLALLRVLIIQRLETLDKELSDISSQHTMDKRIHMEGHDELSSVANEINHMMDIIQASHEQLENRVTERTLELKSANSKLILEIAERKSIEKELLISKEHMARLAHYDSITTLPNRIFFNEILNKTISHAHRHHKSLAVLFVDLDRFKNINDALGHSIGDLVLKEIAVRFSAVLRAGDILARLGGDEFIILLNDISHAKFASIVAKKLLKTCVEPVKVDHHEFFVSVSIGICIFPDDGTSLEDLQRNADMAMYKAKRSGGGVFQYYTKEMNEQAHEHIQLEETLHKALDNNEFVLYYQPKMNLKNGKICGAEALIRWNNPESGIVNPSTFIPLAEETGLIIPIGEWVLREACKTNKKWQDQGYQPIVMSVNLSARQFRDQDLAKVVANILKETGMDPIYLNLEITETTMMDNMDTAIKLLNDIKQMGVEISVDDFGTGYTSISHLRRLPIDVLKIDQSFIKGIPENQNDIAIINATIAMAHNLGMQVIAEGVETLEQLQYLAKNDCDAIQGYFISRPLPEKKMKLQFLHANIETST